LIAAALAIAAIALHLIRQGKPDTEDSLAAQFGLGGPRLPIFVIAALLWIALALILLLGLFGLIFQTLTATSTENYLFYVLRIAGLTTVLGAVIALPFTIIRLQLTQQQTRNQQESLFNDKINEATKGLYARRQVTLGEGTEAKDHWQDNIIQRNAAIDRLEGLAQEKPEETSRIARLLASYLVELSAQVRAVPDPKDASAENLESWVYELPPARSDMEKAAQTLGRLSNVSPLTAKDLNLRGANLQCVDLSGADLMNARLEGANLHGASLHRANLHRAILVGAKLQHAILEDADLRYANLQAAKLSGANLRDANLVNAQMTQVDTRRADLRGANLARSVCRVANFSDALLVESNLSGTNLQGANLEGTDLAGTILENANLRGATLANANWFGTKVQGADFRGATIDPSAVGLMIGKATLPKGWDKDIPNP
ncbi:MAG: pentapeptide repeat-containing protein, partial [Pseudomonadota bacterium]